MAFGKKNEERKKANINKIDLLSIVFSFSFNWKRKEIERVRATSCQWSIDDLQTNVFYLDGRKISFISLVAS